MTTLLQGLYDVSLACGHAQCYQYLSSSQACGATFADFWTQVWKLVVASQPLALLLCADCAPCARRMMPVVRSHANLHDQQADMYCTPTTAQHCANMLHKSCRCVLLCMAECMVLRRPAAVAGVRAKIT